MSDGRIIIDTQINSSGAESGLRSLSGMASAGLSGIATAGVAMGVAIGAATVAVGGLVKASIEQYSQYEQLTGGVQTLFKDSSNTVMQYADNAYKTAGMSANEYMNTITGFSASLLQGLGGDTAKAADIGNMAVTDMADNANKMGTGMENIQNAYQGFAKQNYTMLDNLKLGYGGTKTEMERLLADAGKLTGIKYDINNFSDVIGAIHAIQGEMGITGTTIKEASSTIEGSLNMTKSAWSNLLVGMADDNSNFDGLIDNLVTSVGALGDNLIPRIEIAIGGVAQLIEKLLPPIMDKVPALIMSILPGLVTAGMQVVSSLGTGLLQALPTLLTLAIQIIQTLVNGIQTNLPAIMGAVVLIITQLLASFMQMLPQLLTIGMQIIAQLLIGIGQALPTLIPAAVQCIGDLVLALYDNLPMIIEAGLQLLTGLADGIINALPILIAMLPQIINSMVTYLTQALPMILQTGLTILLALINGLVQCLPQLIAMLPQIIESIVKFLTDNLPTIIDAGIKVLLALIDGLVNALPQLIEMLPQIINTIVNTITDHLPEIITAAYQITIAIIAGIIKALPKLLAALVDVTVSIVDSFDKVNWNDIGINIMKGIGKGIVDGVDYAVQCAKNTVQKIKDSFTNNNDGFKINSPSRWGKDFVGRNIVKGVGGGIIAETPNLLNNSSDMVRQLKASMDFNMAKTTANIAGSANRAAAISNTSNSATTNNNAPLFSVENFYNERDTDIPMIAQELAFYGKRNPVR